MVLGKRGRRSAASLALVPANVENIPRSPPPPELSGDEAAVWNAVVASQPADWFNGSTKLNLAQLCRHAIGARDIAVMIKALKETVADAVSKASSASERVEIMLSAVDALDKLSKMQERETRAMNSTATKLRITQQATINKRGNKIERKKPWEG